MVLSMLQRVGRWSQRKRVLVIGGTGAGSFVIRHLVYRLTDSSAVRLLVNVALIALVGIAVVTYFRVVLKESEEEAKKNPSPW
jgi:hypothetical protein